MLESADFLISYKAPDGWAGVADRGTQVAIDARITAELAGEGMAREVVRQVQELRKQSNLQMEDRIVLYLHTEPAPSPLPLSPAAGERGRGEAQGRPLRSIGITSLPKPWSRNGQTSLLTVRFIERM